MSWWFRLLLTLTAATPLLSGTFAAPRAPISLAAQSAPARPRITGVAGLAVRTKDLATARTFYSTILGLDEAFTIKNPLGGSDLTTFKINEKQYVSVAPDLKDDSGSRLLFVSFETADARALRTYLASKGVAVPAAVNPDPQGNLSLMVKDPEGNNVEFIQFLPNSLHARNAGKFLSPRRLSSEALHVGYRIHDADVMNRFYQDILGYRLMWKGGSTDTVFRWISMIVPDGNQWLEYMVDTGTPSPRTLGIWNHLAFGTLDQQVVAKQVVERGYAAAATPKIGRDGRWLMDLYDADLTRVEFMIRKPVQTPCCSPMHDVVDGEPAPVGMFDDHMDVGTPSTIGGGSAAYDAGRRMYTITGGGENMWSRADHFHFAWKKVSGDVTLSATIQFVGTQPSTGGPDQHRKACLLLRQTLDTESLYADAALHGNGMTSLQWREARGDLSHDVETNVVGPTRLRIEKRGPYVSMFVANPGQPWRPAGGSSRLGLTGDFYVGLGVSAHNTGRLETATFSDVEVGTPAPISGRTVLVSTLETISVSSKDRRVTLVMAQPEAIEAPSWGPDVANTLYFTSRGKRLKIQADVPRAALNLTGPRMPEPASASGDREPFTAGQFIYFASDRTGTMQIWRMHADGTAREQLTTDAAANWLPRISPDGTSLVFLTAATGAGNRLDNTDVTLRRMSLADRKIDVLATFYGGKGSIGTSPFAPTGQHLAFVSYQVVPR